jgi:hypothetical protein
MSELIRCDHCQKEATNPSRWLRVENHGGLIRDVRHFCDIACLRDWAQARAQENELARSRPISLWMEYAATDSAAPCEKA